MRIDRNRFAWWAGAAMLSGLIAGGVAAAQPPEASTGGEAPCRCNRPLHRMFHHTAYTLHDRFIGYPETFIEPPLGTYVREQMSIQVAKADPHRYTLYRTDFLPGTDKFSPTGAARFNLMFARTDSSPCPILLEWTPDRPGLTEARKQAVLAAYQRGGRPIDPDRVRIGPSPYPGGMGTEAGNTFNSLIYRSQQAQNTYPLPPAQNAMAGTTGGTN
ncbi:hypothetical protein [Aquisphaera insulae]|uniref:hypothetical protein n=1 Tax=Aquisphaera insulae TaxID=2712864 RepID=UPI0013EE194D|nr:hypothetical protein [Aquisphaera insulae]